MDLQALGTSPISTENPAGEDVRYNSVFEVLQAEVDKLSSPTASTESVEWEKISTWAAEILSSQSKDLLVASYFCVAQIHLSGIEGLQLGLNVYSDLLENFWDTVFPQIRRMRGRVAAIEWWIERSEIALELMKPNRISETAKDRIVAQCHHIDQILAEHLPDSHPEVHAIVRAVEAIPLELSEEASPQVNRAEPAQPVVAATPEPRTSSSPQQTVPTAPLANLPTSPRPETDAKPSLDSLLQSLRQTAVTFLKQDLTDPLSYRLLRFSLWLKIKDPPPATDGKTMILPPDPQMATILRDLFNKGNWNALVPASEYQLPQYIFWLDLNRYSAVALENLGTPYRKASECLAQETAFFMARFPDLATLKFSDCTPFASQETCDWLQSISLGGAALSIEQMPVGEGNASDPMAIKLAETMQQAQALVKEKKLLDAVALLQQEMRLAFSVKDTMLWRLALCQILISSKNAALAVSHFDQILDDITTYRLEEWDPMLTLQGLKVIWAGLLKISDKEAKERAVIILRQISRIDPVEAIRIGK
jgi:type VI secretion system protein VasJ